tara:strand:+ start:318 stop:476 length:159 start_codon:yes stop_codon:yes gene_type:complete
MLRRTREENAKDKDNISIIALARREITEMQKSIHALQVRVKELAEENHRLKN